MTIKPRPIAGIINIQGRLCQPLKKVRHCKAQLLCDLDEILRVSGLELDFIERSTVRFRAECEEKRARNKKPLDGPDRVAPYQSAPTVCKVALQYITTLVSLYGKDVQNQTGRTLAVSNGNAEIKNECVDF